MFVLGGSQTLDDALVREQLREQVALYVENHSNLFADVEAWAKSKLEYLAAKETCTNSLEARTALNVLDQFCTHKAAKISGDVAALKTLGNTIRTSEHKTEFSQWTYEKPEAITALETRCDELFSELDAAATNKRNILDDDLAREVNRLHVFLHSFYPCLHGDHIWRSVSTYISLRCM